MELTIDKSEKPYNDTYFEGSSYYSYPPPEKKSSPIRSALIVLVFLMIFAYLFYVYMEWNTKMLSNPNQYNLYLTWPLDKGIISQSWINNHKEFIVNKLVSSARYDWAYNVLRFKIIYQWKKSTA